MQETYNREYFESYQLSDDVTDNYDSSPLVQYALSMLAEQIVRDLAPTTSLDVGCATGILVKELRKRGVASHGVDVSEYAISVAKSKKHLSDSVWVLDICSSPLFGWYDVITMIEVAEHLDDECAKRAISKICSHTNTVLFSSTDSEDRETHVNMNPPSYWVDIFSDNGFVVDDSFYCYAIPHAMLFRRSST